MSLQINSKEFFSDYLFHPLKKELSKGDRAKALITSVALGIFTVGIVHLACYLKYRNKKVSAGPSGKSIDGTNSAAKSAKIVPGGRIVKSGRSLKKLEERLKSAKMQPDGKFDPDLMREAVEVVQMYWDPKTGDQKNTITWSQKLMSLPDVESHHRDRLSAVIRQECKREDFKPQNAGEVISLIGLSYPKSFLPGERNKIEGELETFYNKSKVTFPDLPEFKDLLDNAKKTRLDNDRAFFTPAVMATLLDDPKFSLIRQDPTPLLFENANIYLEQLGNNGHEDALKFLITMYRFGNPNFAGTKVEADPSKRFQWMIKYIDDGKINNIRMKNDYVRELLKMEIEEKVVPLDLVRVRKYLDLAIKQKEQNSLALCYLYNGEWVSNEQQIEDLIKKLTTPSSSSQS